MFSFKNWQYELQAKSTLVGKHSTFVHKPRRNGFTPYLHVRMPANGHNWTWPKNLACCVKSKRLQEILYKKICLRP
jgi:hypothetical protein